jgi:hypothetical protein
MDEIRVVALSGLGLLPLDPSVSLDHAVARNPSVIAMDAGSGDIGPYYLGADAEYNPISWERNDLKLLLLAARKLDVPLIVGNCCGAGTARGVDEYCAMIADIAQEESLSGFKLARIYSDVSREYLHRSIDAGRVEGLGMPSPLTHQTVDATAHVVAMMGVDPIVRALDEGAQVIIAGRSCDDALHAAFPLHSGFPREIAFLAGKTMENASTAATPFTAREALLGTLTRDSLVLEPMMPAQIATPFSVTAEIFYERRNPFFQPGPGGQLDLTAIEIVQHTPRSVRLTGARYEVSPQYKVKLEGAGWLGARSLSMVGVRDPRMVERIDAVVDSVRERIHARYSHLATGSYAVHFHLYGRDALMGALEPETAAPRELGIMIEVLAPDQETANEIAIFARRAHFLSKYEGQKATAGSASFTPDECLEGVPAYRWTMDHLLTVADPRELFPVRYERVGSDR